MVMGWGLSNIYTGNNGKRWNESLGQTNKEPVPRCTVFKQMFK